MPSRKYIPIRRMFTIYNIEIYETNWKASFQIIINQMIYFFTVP